MHGKGFKVYRSFGNVGKGCNVAIHSWLTELDGWYNETVNGHTLPDTIYYAIDGGSENANDTTVGMAELLVCWGLTKKVVITRLPPGHTHNDIDGEFGVIWKHNWKKNILTPQEQKAITLNAFKKSKDRGRVVDMIDVFAVPDYRGYLARCVNLKRAYQYKGHRYKTTQ